MKCSLATLFVSGVAVGGLFAVAACGAESESGSTSPRTTTVTPTVAAVAPQTSSTASAPPVVASPAESRAPLPAPAVGGHVVAPHPVTTVEPAPTLPDPGFEPRPGY